MCCTRLPLGGQPQDHVPAPRFCCSGESAVGELPTVWEPVCIGVDLEATVAHEIGQRARLDAQLEDRTVVFVGILRVIDAPID